MAVVCMLVVGSSCGKAASDQNGAQVVLARVDDIVITDADLKEVMGRYASQPFVLARYSTPEKKKELLDSIIRYDVLLIEARRRGYEHDPEVQRVAREKMVRLFAQKEILDAIKPSDISEAEIRKFYSEHSADYMRPESVRASQILIKDRGKALKVLSAARALSKADSKGFRDLVATYSEDPDSKPRGGDTTELDRTSTDVPKAIVNAAFALKEVGDIADLLVTDKGFVVLKLTDRRPALSQSLDEVRSEIQRRLLEDARSKKRKEYVDEARKSVHVEINEDALTKLDLVSPSAAQPRGIDAGSMVGSRP